MADKPRRYGDPSSGFERFAYRKKFGLWDATLEVPASASTTARREAVDMRSY